MQIWVNGMNLGGILDNTIFTLKICKFWSWETHNWLLESFGTKQLKTKIGRFFCIIWGPQKMQILVITRPTANKFWGYLGQNIVCRFGYFLCKKKMQILVIGDTQMTFGGIWGNMAVFCKIYTKLGEKKK